MTVSVKRSVNASNLAGLSKSDMRSLFIAIQGDLANIKTTLTTLQSDGNNTTTALANVLRAFNSIIANCTGAGANVNNFVNNVGNVTFGNGTPSALNLAT